jgi:PAS domain S-box-containing protein
MSDLDQVPELPFRDSAEQRYRQLVEQIPAAVFMHPLEPDQPPFFISPRIEEITGYHPDELLTERDFLTRLVHPEDREAMRPLGERTDRTLEPFIATYRLRRKDGRWIWLYNETEIVRDPSGVPLYWQGLVIDITAQKEAELALAASEARFRALVQRSTDTTMIVQDGIGFVWISPAIRNIIGWEPAVPDDHLKAKLVHPDDLPAVNRMARDVRLAPGAIATSEGRFLHADGSWRWVEIVGVNHTDNPSVNGIVYNVREITERKDAEQAMTRALELQQQANEELVALGKDRAEFLAMLAHDLRTPLTAVLGLTDLLRSRQQADPEMTRYLDTISSNAGRLSRLVSEMLHAESLEARLSRIEREPASLNEIVSVSAASVRAAWPGHEIRLELAPSLPEIIADRDAMIRALTNLVANAVTYSPGGEPVMVSTRQTATLVEVEVRDRGVGIPAANLERIFDRHVRVRSHSTRDIEGFGLGLPIVRAIARAHGGDVTVDSAEGTGSTFVFWVPVAPVFRDGDLPRSTEPRQAASPSPRLLAEDLWTAIAPILPAREHRPKGGRPWADDRAVITGILFTVWTGAAWSDVPQGPGTASPATCWRRFRQWQELGLWAPVEDALAGLAGGRDRAAWERACPPGGLALAPSVGMLSTVPTP